MGWERGEKGKEKGQGREKGEGGKEGVA